MPSRGSCVLFSSRLLRRYLTDLIIGRLNPAISPPITSSICMPGIPLPLHQRSFGETSRRDNWWIQPALIFVGLSTFIVYATWAAFQGEYYTVPDTNYLSPFYSPVLFGPSDLAWFGSFPSWWPKWFSSPAILILWGPAG